MPSTHARSGRSEATRVRLNAEEKSGLKELAEALGEKEGRILRRLLREALNGGPEYFLDGLEELRSAHREVASVGRNFNQLVRAVNADDRAVPCDLVEQVVAARDEVRRIERVFRAAVDRIGKRRVAPLGAPRG